MKQKKNYESEGAADEQRHEWRIGADDLCQKKRKMPNLTENGDARTQKGFLHIIILGSYLSPTCIFRAAM